MQASAGPAALVPVNDAVTMLCWVQVYSELFDDATPERMDALFKYLDKQGRGADLLPSSLGAPLNCFISCMKVGVFRNHEH